MAVSHLQKVKRGYWSHARHALGLSFIFLRVGMAGVVHAFVPEMYTNNMSLSVDKIKHLIWQDQQRARRIFATAKKEEKIWAEKRNSQSNKRFS